MNCETPSSSSSSPDPAISGICKICGGNSNGVHWGIDVCRACTAFFRRAVQTRRTNTWMGGHCARNRECAPGRFCKTCRFQRCLDLGMQPIKVYEKLRQPVSVAPPHVPMLLTDKLWEQYKRLESKLHTEELAVHNARSACGTAVRTRSGEVMMFYPATAELVDTIYSSFFTAYYEFVAEAFTDLNKLDMDTALMFILPYATKLFLAECFSKAIALFEERPLTKFLITYFTYIPYDSMETFFADVEPMANSDALLATTERLFGRARDAVVPFMQRLNLSDAEYSALLVLLLWSADCPNASDAVLDMAESNRRQVFTELHTYYSMVVFRDDYAERLGDILTLTDMIKMLAQEAVTELRLLNFYDFLRKESIIRVVIGAEEFAKPK